VTATKPYTPLRAQRSPARAGSFRDPLRSPSGRWGYQRSNHFDGGAFRGMSTAGATGSGELAEKYSFVGWDR